MLNDFPDLQLEAFSDHDNLLFSDDLVDASSYIVDAHQFMINASDEVLWIKAIILPMQLPF